MQITTSHVELLRLIARHAEHGRPLGRYELCAFLGWPLERLEARSAELQRLGLLHAEELRLTLSGLAVMVALRRRSRSTGASLAA